MFLWIFGETERALHAACGIWSEVIHMQTPTLEAPGQVLLDRQEVLRKRKRYWMLRRAQDIVLSILALALLWPFMLLLCLIIWIDSPGASPIFSQTRVGRDGKEFRFYKFRSMIPDAEEKLPELLEQNQMQGPAFKMKEDPRITRVGNFIRKSSIDELPQLWNILRGEMSIVGPRPPLPREVAEYGDYERQRLLVTPGLTCYWQIAPDHNDMSFHQWVEMDLKYIRDSYETNGFLTDWKIIFGTVGVVLDMRGQ